jgi:hypothetical protein
MVITGRLVPFDLLDRIRCWLTWMYFFISSVDEKLVVAIENGELDPKLRVVLLVPTVPHDLKLEKGDTV